MNITKPHAAKSIFTEGEPGTFIVPPRITSMMTGVASCFAAHPRYRLTYTDGTTEEATCPDLQQGADIIAITSAVQSRRAA